MDGGKYEYPYSSSHVGELLPPASPAASGAAATAATAAGAQLVSSWGRPAAVSLRKSHAPLPAAAAPGPHAAV